MRKAAAWLDETTIMRKLPNLTPDEIQSSIENREIEDMERFGIDGGK